MIWHPEYFTPESVNVHWEKATNADCTLRCMRQLAEGNLRKRRLADASTIVSDTSSDTRSHMNVVDRLLVNNKTVENIMLSHDLSYQFRLNFC